ncbi:chemotaxis response regulator protein-glutamate methylesterase [Halobacillus yeomjeoni]|uniref:protein-glutamate methylesterase/protein-glutamine glutaminase n=1 Tax=Halobacillus yeomjeoni TaxID=311194 RepID=UPI001CD47C64|nr:chemotaxis response regulator protein-glutamate methylesterase [Halobacillus yeomjeoni]MCA0983309.1 chemotaxis response regulator protein-glutamate methylesterase [Halobacillus yeomjeoni]
MKKLKVLVVDDSAFMRRVLKDILQRDVRIEVVATARNGVEGLEKAEEFQPDVITLDIEMPVMDGLEMLAVIMSDFRIPVVVVSTFTQEHVARTIHAMTSGTVDFIEKPSGPISLDMKKVGRQVIDKVIAASHARPEVHFKRGWVENPKGERTGVVTNTSEVKQILTVGTSTGGPRALQTVLSRLPEDLNSPVVIVQHMPEKFTKSLADRLNECSALHVKQAEQYEPLLNGTAYIAPGGRHMSVIEREGTLLIELDDSESIGGHRPSVNRLLNSLASFPSIPVLSIILTGMGADGTDGMIELKKKHPSVYCIAEDKKTCVVYGMPKAVVRSGLADEVLPITSMPERIINHLKEQRRELGGK